MTVLQINSSARSEGSSTRTLSQSLIAALDQPVIALEPLQGFTQPHGQ